MIPAIVVVELIDTIIYAAIAGVGLTATFSFAIYGATRCADLGREERPFAAIAAGVFALIAFLICLAAAIGGIAVMVD